MEILRYFKMGKIRGFPTFPSNQDNDLTGSPLLHLWRLSKILEPAGLIFGEIFIHIHPIQLIKNTMV